MDTAAAVNITTAAASTTTATSPLSLAAAAASSLLLLALLLEQISYLRKKRFVPGPPLVVPLLGSAVPMIVNPTRYWDRLARLASSSSIGFSADYLVGRFILFLRSSDLSHKVFSNVRPDAFMVIGHPFGKRLFGEHNLIYMFGQHHKDLRGRMAPNFTPRSLSTYLHIQQRIIARHISLWLSLSRGRAGETPLTLRTLFREMNLETSQTVFAGPYLSPEARHRFNRDYNLFNVGLMAIPFDLPGFSFRRARLAVARLASTLAVCASHSRAKMASRLAEPTCLVDYWMQEILRETADTGGAMPIPETGDVEVGGHLFDFLFAAQDASTSSLLWAVALLESHPDVLARVREEVAAQWTPESGEPITEEKLRAMRYTERVVREVLRYRPPATMVPHMAQEDFPLTEYYTVPRGTIVFPSTLEASLQGFSEPERFDPDRFSDERQEDRVYRRNFLAFGAGPHQCAGQRYAMNHLHLFIVLFVSLVNFKRHRVDAGDEDEIAYMPTIVPKDECKVYLSQRCKRFPDL